MQLELDGQIVHAATGGVDVTGPKMVERPAVLLLHGAGMDGTIWQNQTRFLAHRDLRALAVDLPGHGRSGGEPLKSIADMADWIARFATAAGLDNRPGGLHLAGHSMGSMIALEAARRHRQLVRSMVLMGTADAMPVHPELISSSEDELGRAAALMAAWGHGRAAHVGLNPVPGMWMLGSARALVENSRPGALTADFNACANYDEATAAMATVVVPTLILMGTEDKMTSPKGTAELAAAADPGWVTVQTLPGVGHSMMTEDPRVVRRAILDAVKAAEAGPVSTSV